VGGQVPCVNSDKARAYLNLKEVKEVEFFVSVFFVCVSLSLVLLLLSLFLISLFLPFF